MFRLALRAAPRYVRPVAVPRAMAVRAYSAASLTKEDVTSRVLDVLKSFEKVDASKVSSMRPRASPHPEIEARGGVVIEEDAGQRLGVLRYSQPRQRTWDVTDVLHFCLPARSTVAPAGSWLVPPGPRSH